jgi:hypothetical protein
MNNIREFGVFLVLVLAFLTSACGSGLRPEDFDARPFATQSYNLVLCLDLQTDLSPTAGLVVNANPNIAPGQHYVVLPFESTHAQSNQEIFSTWGSFSKFTLVSYFASERMSTGNGLGLAPRIRVYGQDELIGSEASRDTVYMIASGQDRKLVFRYLTPEQQSLVLPPQLQNLSFDNLDAVAVRLPEQAKKIGDTVFLNEKPQHQLEKPDLRIRYYPGNFGQAKTANLELMYLVKPNVIQDSFVEYASKFVGVIFVPSLDAFLLAERRNKRSSQKKATTSDSHSRPYPYCRGCNCLFPDSWCLRVPSENRAGYYFNVGWRRISSSDCSEHSEREDRVRFQFSERSGSYHSWPIYPYFIASAGDRKPINTRPELSIRERVLIKKS